MKNLYVYQINDECGQQVLADSLDQATAFVKREYMTSGDVLSKIELMGTNYDSSHWENEHLEIA